jgi:hypothetical protein
VAEVTDAERELQTLTAELRKLEGEYTMYFSGRLPRPPWETRGKVDQLFKKFDRRPTDTLVTRFRLQTLQTRYSRFTDMWDRALRAREEGRHVPGMGPAGRQRIEEGPPPPPPVIGPDGLVHKATFKDPIHEMDKVHELYDSLMDARRSAGEDVVPFHKFADLVKEQVTRLKNRGSAEVTFRVTTAEGRVNLTARPDRSDDY